MGKIKVTDWNVVDYLKTEEDIAGYLEAVAEENNPKLLISALNDVARARSINKIAKQINVGRESLYKSLSGDVKVSFETIHKILDSLGLRFSIVPKV
ncbi:MAG: putative addiction module antidote protein [Rickettsiales bacterium]|jgi:probable addiction module antidote protein|nr:putative addiction module antidote protein [Rickettsiales bacterium]